MRRVARLPRNRGIQTTTKLLGCAVLFVVTYLAVGVAVGRRWGAPAGFVALLAAPACGYLTLRTTERLHDAGGVAHLRRSLRRTGNRQGVWADRQRVVSLAHDLLAIRVPVPGPAPGSRPDEST